MIMNIFGELQKEERSMAPTMLHAFYIIIYLPAATLLRVFVIMSLWNWFMPLVGFQTIGMALTYGIFILFNFVKGYPKDSVDLEQTDAERVEKVISTMIFGIMFPIITFTLGFITSMFV